MSADATRFGPVMKKAIKPIVTDELIPQYIAQNRSVLLKEMAREKLAYHEPRTPGLVALYNRIGVQDYDWKTFGPDLTEIKWAYHSFDPPEEKIWMAGGTRYREVTFPKGMENWFAPAFDAKAAGWKTGFAPFGQEEGKLRTEPKPWVDQEIVRPLKARQPCRSPECRCCDPMQTLWEREVLLLRGRIALPKLDEDHFYRLVLGGQGCMNNGDGFRVYVNGKLMFQRDRGWGKRESGPMAVRVDKEWLSEFEGGEVDIAVISFLRIHIRSNIKGNILSVFMQQMKIPPLGEKEMLNSIKVMPMTSAKWQSLQNPEAEGEDSKQDPEAGKFTWDGKFEPNKAIEGSWVQMGQVTTIEAFKPAERIHSNKGWPLQELELKAGGKTGEALYMWTGDILMDLNANQALKMTMKAIDGADYLFIEAGGFNARLGSEWKCPLYVMKRK